MTYQILYSCVSHTGNVRKLNQDNFACAGRFLQAGEEETAHPLKGAVSSKQPSLFGIFDGMGGEECGEVASLLAAKAACAVTPGADPIGELSRLCQKANADICAYAAENGVSSMGTTAAMLAFTPDGITLCNIGDSRIFRFSKGILEQISKDHVAAAPFGQKPPLSQCLGIPPDEMRIEPYLAQGAYAGGDRYLICSDGLTDMVTAAEIAETLSAAPAGEACAQLLQKALAGGGRDNISIIVCEVRHTFSLPFKKWLQSIQKEGSYHEK